MLLRKLAILSLMVVMFSGAAVAETLVLKFAHEAPETAMKGQTAKKFADFVEKHSNGSIKVDVFPGGQLVPTKEEIRAAVRGQIDIIAPITTYYSAIDTSWDIFYQPMLFESVEQSMDAFAGPVGETVLSKLEKRGLIGLGIWHDGPVYLFMKSAPVKSADGLKGKKIRVFPSRPLESFLAKVGSSPVSMPATEVYLALQQGVVDGVLTTPTYAAPAKWYEVLKGMTRSMMGVGGYGVAISKRTWDKLDDNQRSIINKSMQDAIQWNHGAALANIKTSEKTLMDNGVEIIDLSPDVDKAWSDLAKGVYEEQDATVKELVSKLKGN